MANRPALTRSRNALLSAIRGDQAKLLEADLEPVDLTLGETPLLEYEQTEWAIFPEEAVLSVVRILADGSMIEVGVIGYDGVMGIHSLTESAEQPYRVIVQNQGSARRLPIRRLREEFRRGGELQELLLQFSSRFLMQVSQTAACNRLHTIERRLARWLLMMRDRTMSDELNLTQEFLSHMLGTRIAGVNEALRSLTLSALVKHARGSIQIIDREGLELAACECYGVMRNGTGTPPS